MIKYISGSFTEGNSVTLSIEGKEVTRKVRYNNNDGLYIVCDNTKYFEYEVEY